MVLGLILAPDPILWPTDWGARSSRAIKNFLIKMLQKKTMRTLVDFLSGLGRLVQLRQQIFDSNRELLFKLFNQGRSGSN